MEFDIDDLLTLARATLKLFDHVDYHHDTEKEVHMDALLAADDLVQCLWSWKRTREEAERVHDE